MRAGRFRIYQQSEYLEVASDFPFGFATFGHFKWMVQFNLHLRTYCRAGVFSKLSPTPSGESALQSTHNVVESEKANESKGIPNQVNSHSLNHAKGFSVLGQ